MSGIAIYFEGGGDSTHGKAALRRGMTQFLASLRDARGPRNLRFRVIACGSRDDAYRAFSNSLSTDPEETAILLVDSEDPFKGDVIQHLTIRDGWNLADEPEDRVHLMAQTMETWIVADQQALIAYYGQSFAVGALPKNPNLEQVPKDSISQALERATSKTQKGTYHKIHHASALLERIDPAIVRKQCPMCNRLFQGVLAKIEQP